MNPLTAPKVTTFELAPLLRTAISKRLEQIFPLALASKLNSFRNFTRYFYILMNNNFFQFSILITMAHIGISYPKFHQHTKKLKGERRSWTDKFCSVLTMYSLWFGIIYQHFRSKHIFNFWMSVFQVLYWGYKLTYWQIHTHLWIRICVWTLTL